jgi:DEAD/DEAH box helicase domain-containing protein
MVFQAAALQQLLRQEDACTLVFYPLKALAADQLGKWQGAAEAVGLSGDLIRRIDGDVPLAQRDELLRTSRIVLMTPDVCQSWLMRNVSNPVVKTFLSNLALLVLDEAHVLEAVFGSNVAFLLRRLQAARYLAGRKRENVKELQVIAASATIANAAEHLQELTGLDFEVIGENDDGSPRHSRSLFHVAAKTNDSSVLREILSQLVNRSSVGSFIAFRDSRQDVERIVIGMGHDGVRPYRSGYEPSDRAAIEAALRSGQLRGVVSTSALELGIDIAHFALALNVDVPQSKKAFRQRLGRAGRTGPGAFVVIAEPAAFKRFGSTFRDYYEGSVEPSHLYLQNRFMQFAHGRCLLDELEMLGAQGRVVPPGNIKWPTGFVEVFEYARPGGARPREFDHIHRLGGDSPHFNYPVRNVGEETFVIKDGGQDFSAYIGDINLQQAIREAFPGATYLHLSRAYRIQEWRSTSFERAIRVSSVSGKMFPKPLIRTYINASISHDGLVENHFRFSEAGALAECNLQITERVEGYQIGKEKYLYKDLRQQNPAMTAKTRDFRTTGVLLRIDQDWFKGKVKDEVAGALRGLMQREYSIAPQDIQAAATNIALVEDGIRRPITDAVVVYDQVYGSLRLTEPVFVEFTQLLDKLQRAAELAPEDSAVSPQTLSLLSTWYEALKDADADLPGQISTEAGEILVFAPGSFVAVRGVQGVLRDIEIIEPIIMLQGEQEALFYKYKANRGQGLVPASEIEPLGQDWSYVIWNPATNSMRSADEIAA